MSLVDYASSDEDEAEVREEEEKGEKPQVPIEIDEPQVPKNDPPLPQRNQKLGPLAYQPPDNSNQPEPSTLQLPDASLLLNSSAMPSHLVGSSDHYSRVAAAMAENTSRKRESNVTASGHPRSKIPRGTLPHSRSVPDTVAGLLLPPQVGGRSNVVTEDISKLFVKKQHADSR